MSSLEYTEPEIDFTSSNFNDPDYEELKERIRNHCEMFPELKVVDTFVYIRTKHYTGDEWQEELAWKLWIPENLRLTAVKRSHDSPVTSHGEVCTSLELLRRAFY